MLKDYATATQTVRQSLPAEAYDTLGQATGLVARVMELADRLCGPVPTGAGDTDAAEAPPSGEFGKMRRVMRDTRDALADANVALDRIERELV